MSDLPALALIRRLVNDFGEVWDREIIDAFKAGELKTRDEMNAAAALDTWYTPPKGNPYNTLQRVEHMLDAAFEAVPDE